MSAIVLPHDVWGDYVFDPRDFCVLCEKRIRWGQEHHGSCELCNANICEDCSYFGECDVCTERKEQGKSFKHGGTMCFRCMETCSECVVWYHPDCRKRHDRTCTALGRARRAFEDADEAVDEKERRIKIREDKLKKDQEELAALKKAQRKAKRKLDSLY